MDIGLILPTIGAGAGAEGLEAGAAAAARNGWSSVWVTDHLMVANGPEAGEYGTILEAIVSLAHVSALNPGLTIGTSVVIPPMRNSVILAKELATLDILSRGRLIVGVGVADQHDLVEFRNLGAEDRFQKRGDLVDETILLWRHLWGGGGPPFLGEFHQLDDYVFQPLPPQAGKLPIWTGGRSGRAIRRAAALADGYHAAQTGPDDLLARIPALRQLTEDAGRPFPTISVRTRVRFDQDPGPVFSLCGTAQDMKDTVRRFEEAGAEHLILALGETAPDRITTAIERFQTDVVGSPLA
jgi:alkanesulfonate monooxygenase SsuD/methylene tetrahydromethanopterin reductase-like flavin-dependent oxidoreductase (luciferase family)